MLFIRCKIDGVQQMGRKLSLDDTIKYKKTYLSFEKSFPT